MYIPILKTLQFIYSHPNIKEMVQADSRLGDVLEDFAKFSRVILCIQNLRMPFRFSFFMMILKLQIPWDPNEEYIK